MSALSEFMILLSWVWTSWQLRVPLPLDNRMQLAAKFSPVQWPWGIFFSVQIFSEQQKPFLQETTSPFEHSRD